MLAFLKENQEFISQYNLCDIIDDIENFFFFFYENQYGQLFSICDMNI